MKKTLRKFKTPVLGIIAMAVMLWGVHRAFHVSYGEMFALFKEVSPFFLFVIALGSLAALVLRWWTSRRDDS
ncbi:hypothetical protein [Umboniibacter marinipuniceus]|uniref:Uncharacterized protein n=1 Tax=Umboniibacter marinipuniceus TaxID=569599 RepID=A0A3M0A9S7_9GAMM|nr:hypothetical protein [Umboniibacter marinipuniceus]RMA81287.1 hypothetical protein DFR27_1096 [Umboniibacter marinipuniceus]